MVEVVPALAVNLAVPVACSFLVLPFASKLDTFIAFKVAPALTTKTSPVVKSLTVSVPLSILKVSLPPQPNKVSLPAPPLNVSLPAPPTRVSLPEVPL